MCADGTPKVTDFNTAKFKGYLNPGVTMMEFVTRPYAPPETESPDQPETRDVFSYAVLAVRCFQKEEFVDYADVDASLEKCPLPERIATILRRALSRDPSERPANVLELLEAIDEGQASSPTSVTGIPIPIVLTKTAIAKLKAVFSENDETRVKARLNSDLSESPRVRLFITGNNADGLVFDNETIELFTLENYYKLALSADTRAGFVVTGAFTAEPSFIERRKSLAFSAHVRFVVANSIAESDSTSSAIDRLLADLVEHEARNKQAAADRAEEEVFRIWDSILRAKNKIEQRREQPLRYSDFKVLEGRITFLLKDAIPDDLIGQARLVKLPEGGSLKGEIEAIEGANVVLACEYDVRADEVPLRGELIIDTSLSRLAVQRQMEALTAVRFGRALRPDLRNMLCNPSSVRIPVPTIVDTWAQEDLDASKRNAVESALGSSDVLIVRGPPGTGKTKFISELVAQELRRSKVAKILLTVTDNPTAS